MINKTNLIRLANTSPMVRQLLYTYSRKVTFAKSIDEYANDVMKPRYDFLIEYHNACHLTIENYEEACREVYLLLSA